MQQEVSRSLGQDSRFVSTIVSCFRRHGRSGSEIDFQSTVPQQTGTLLDHLSQVIASKSRPALIVMGHSWGGTLAAELVVQVKQVLEMWAQDPRLAHLRSMPILLVTIDPIDSHYCTPPAFNVLGNSECLKGPTTFAPGGPLYQTITHSVRGWLNIFQTEGILLHSGPVGQYGPRGPLVVDWHLGGLGLTAHQEIARDARTWAAVQDWVLRFVSEAI
jgi:hypothetical protein